MNQPKGECVFRGWPSEVKGLVRRLSAAGISTEAIETFVPSPVGIGVYLAEIFVPPGDVEAARRVIERKG